MRPGSATSGSVTIRNAGTAAATLALEGHDLIETPGPRGGRLGRALVLVVREQRSGRRVYAGPMAGLGRRSLGTWSAGEARAYRFDVSLPASAPGVQSVQGAGARISFRWTAGAAAAPTPAPGPGPAPTAPPPTPPAADTTPPRVTVKAPRRQKLRRRALKVKVTCDEPCRVTRVSLRRSRVKAPAILRPGAPATVRIRLSRKAFAKARRKLAKRRNAVIRLKLTARDMSGNTASARIAVRIKR
jgi:hypothetical protein